MATDGLTLWSTRRDGDDVAVYLGNPTEPGTEVWLAPLGIGERLTAEHNRQIEWARTTLLAEKAAGRPSLSAAEIEAALTRIAVKVAAEVAKSLGPVAVTKWLLRAAAARGRRRSPRPPAAAPMTERPTPPAA